MEEFIDKLPKAELHIHIEGSMTTQCCMELAARNSIEIISEQELHQLRSNYPTFMDFSRVYDIGCSVLLTGQDFYDIAYQYFQVCAKENILYCEVIFTSTLYHSREITFQTIFEAYLRAAEDAKREFNVTANWILTFVKHLPLEDNMKMLQDSIPYKDKIIAIGIAGAEIGQPASKFRHLYEEARRIGYKNFAAHCGEEGDPTSIIDTLHHLQVTRIDHGVRCLEDPHLVKFLVGSDIWLTICPLSNYHLGILDKYFSGEHIVHELIEKGLKITINSDDPSLLGGFLNNNYRAVAKILGDKPESEIKKMLVKLAKDSFRAAFISD